MPDAPANLTAKTAEFCARLRGVHGFNIGPRETLEAAEALDLVGIERRGRVAAALRAICCGRPQEIEIFGSGLRGVFFKRSARHSANSGRAPAAHASVARRRAHAR